MKKIMLSALLAAFTATATFAIPAKTIKVETTTQQEKTPVKLEELPDAVKSALAGDEYTGWTPTAAFAVNNEEGKKYFEIQLKNEDEVKVVNLDEEGKPVETLIEQ